jgi:hypothetical protein
VCIYDMQSRVPYWSFGSAADNDLWLVKGISTPDITPAEEIAQRVDALLTDAALEMTGRRSLYLRRAHDVSYEELDQGVRYHHRGASYRVWSEPA